MACTRLYITALKVTLVTLVLAILAEKVVHSTDLSLFFLLSAPVIITLWHVWSTLTGASCRIQTKQRDPSSTDT